MTRQHPDPGIPGRGLFLVATDVGGRVSLAGARALDGFGHVTVAEGARGSSTFFGPV